MGWYLGAYEEFGVNSIRIGRIYADFKLCLDSFPVGILQITIFLGFQAYVRRNPLRKWNNLHIQNANNVERSRLPGLNRLALLNFAKLDPPFRHLFSTENPQNKEKTRVWSGAPIQ